MCLAIGTIFAALAAYLFNSSLIEILAFVVISILLLYFVRPFFKKNDKKVKSCRIQCRCYYRCSSRKIQD
jgi:membrane protein implicated in regulation of membrane protease activity